MDLDTFQKCGSPVHLLPAMAKKQGDSRLFKQLGGAGYSAPTLLVRGFGLLVRGIGLLVRGFGGTVAATIPRHNRQFRDPQQLDHMTSLGGGQAWSKNSHWSLSRISVEIGVLRFPPDDPWVALYSAGVADVPRQAVFPQEPDVQFIHRLLCMVLVAVLCAFAQPPALAAELLTVGSEAPPLDVEHWVQDGNGQFKPVTKFAPGKVYVVEFWATWCGPCVQSMPHLAALQKQYGKQQLQIVSISDEELETVETFLEREIRGRVTSDQDEGPKTYRELTSGYCLTTDPDQSTYRDYMEAAAKGGIPTAFIVGKDAKIEWIGHPMELDGPLEAVITDSWDRAAYIEQLKRQEQVEQFLAIADIRARQADIDGALEMLDKVIELQSDELPPKLQKLLLLIQSERFDAAETYLKQLFATAKDFNTKDVLAWNIYKFAAQGYLPRNQLVQTAIDSARAAVEGAEQQQQSSLLDTIGHLLFVDGKLDAAIETENRAVALAGDENREFIQEFIEELMKAKEAEKN